MKYVLPVALSFLMAFTISAAWAQTGLSVTENDADREKPLVFVYADTYPPLSQGSGTDVKGLLPELVDRVVHRQMGMPVRHWGEAWPRAQHAVKTGTAFALITSLNSERLSYANASREPILTLPFRFFSMVGSQAGQLVARGGPVGELTGFRYCKARADGWSEQYFTMQKIKYVEAHTYETCLRMMDLDRVDIIVHSDRVIREMATSLGLDAKLVAHPYIVPESPKFHLLVSKRALGNETFLNRFDRIFHLYRTDRNYIELISDYGYE